VAVLQIIKCKGNERLKKYEFQQIFFKIDLFESKVLQKINKYEPDLIVLAGFY
jgi:folate-dependent phosphoribosylglycinamide formyltransferase PurN